jgi:predicted SAM-dependent methyltransferase
LPFFYYDRIIKPIKPGGEFMTTSKDELKQEQASQETAKQAENRPKPQKQIHHSLEELLKIAMDMGDQRVIDAVKKKMEE